jgi:uncharacterized protein YbjT (DUF2867 family)
MEKTIVVVGATGKQGGSVVRALLKNNNNNSNKWKIKGLTRKVNSEASQKLSQNGVEMLSCDINNREQLKKAFEGAYAIFSVTNFWEHGAEMEYKQGILMADVAEEFHVEHYIWSSLPNCEKITGGKYKVPHFTKKAEIEEYIKTKKMSSTFVHAGSYLDNFQFPPLKPRFQNGIFIIQSVLPDNVEIPLIDTENMGPIVVKILEEGKEKWNHKDIPVAGETLTMKDVCKIFSEVTHHPTQYHMLDSNIFLESFRSYGGEELLEMYNYIRDYGYFPKNFDLSLCKKLNPNMTTWKKYLESHPEIWKSSLTS